MSLFFILGATFMSSKRIVTIIPEDLGDNDIALGPRLENLLVLQGITKSTRKNS